MQSGGTGTRSSGLLYEVLVALTAPVGVPGHDRSRLTSGEERVQPYPRCVGGFRSLLTSVPSPRDGRSVARCNHALKGQDPGGFHG
jgi:hypothetical protein